MPEWQRRRTSVWRIVVCSWREAAAVHAKKSLNSVMYVSAPVVLQFEKWITPKFNVDLVSDRVRAPLMPAFQSLKGR